jgi:O-antigen/teichoic acid export membrane protein
MAFRYVSTRHADVAEDKVQSMSNTVHHASGQRAGRDIAMQIVVRVINLALGVVVTALIARSLGRAGYGQWSTIFVVLTLVGYIANFGLENVAVREAARDPEREHEWIGAVILLRFVVLVPAILLSIIAIFALHESRQMLVAGLILVITMPFSGTGALQLVFRLRLNNLVPMLVLTLRSVLWAIAVAIIYWRGGSMITLAIALTVTNAIGSIAQTVAALKLADRRPKPSRALLAPLMRASLPIGVSGLLIVAYARIDQLIVFEVVGSSAAGLYGSVYNVLEQAQFVPIAILTTLAPIMAASWPNDRDRLLRTVRRASELMAIASFGALAFVVVAATPLVRLFFGQAFVAAAPALPVLGGAFVFICFSYLDDNLLLVLGLQRRRLFIGLLALAVNVAGNLVFVPIVGFMGAAWMTLATEAVVLAASVRLILSELDVPLPKPGRVGRALLAAILLTGVLMLVSTLSRSLAVYVVTSCICYPALLFGLRAFSLEDFHTLLGSKTLP